MSPPSADEAAVGLTAVVRWAVVSPITGRKASRESIIAAQSGAGGAFFLSTDN
jgi:hypothetical protein